MILTNSINGKRNLKTSTYFSQLMAKCEFVQYRQRCFHMRERCMTLMGLWSLHYYARLGKKNSWEDLQICYLTWYPQHLVPDKYWCFLSISEITASKCISNCIIWVSKWGTKIQTLFWFLIHILYILEWCLIISFFKTF